MTEENKRFLDFNGKNINILAKDGQYWVAVKPICEALGFNYSRMYKYMQEDDISSLVLSIQTMPDKKNQLQEVLCLPEKYIYGWLFSLNTNSEQQRKNKKECYDLLYAHFHGAAVA